MLRFGADDETCVVGHNGCATLGDSWGTPLKRGIPVGDAIWVFAVVEIERRRAVAVTGIVVRTQAKEEKTIFRRAAKREERRMGHKLRGIIYVAIASIGEFGEVNLKCGHRCIAVRV
jgi:hypothetical protein